MDLTQQVQDLVAAYGPDKVRIAFSQLLGKSQDKLPVDYVKVLHPEAIKLTMDQLDFLVTDIADKGAAKEKAYGDKGGLLKRRSQLETDIKLSEANAIMNVQGEGRSQYATIEGRQIALTNDTARDAYRRLSSQVSRKELAQVEGELAAIDVAVAQKTDAWYSAKEVSENVRAKAHLQASLLNWLAGHA